VKKRTSKPAPMRSRFETHVAQALTDMGVRFDYEAYALEYHKPIREGFCPDAPGLVVYQRRWYYPDFWLPDHGFFIEAKGKFGQADRMKMRWVKDAHPNEDIRMVFMRDNYIGKKATTRTRYTEYAVKYGLPSVVLENLEELFK
jgi:hypothetical protein